MGVNRFEVRISYADRLLGLRGRKGGSVRCQGGAVAIEMENEPQRAPKATRGERLDDVDRRTRVTVHGSRDLVTAKAAN